MYFVRSRNTGHDHTLKLVVLPMHGDLGTGR
jgi:hypothetical protein